MASYILIVDDEPDVRELFRITLKMAGYRTESVNDGVEAMAEIDKETPLLVVLDLMMPRMDGFEVLRRLREDKPESGGLKVIVATAKTLTEGDRDKLMTWPVVGVLNKGELDIAEMVLDIKRLLAKPEKALPGADEKVAKQTAGAEPPQVGNKPDKPTADETRKQPALVDKPGVSRADETLKRPALREKPDVSTAADETLKRPALREKPDKPAADETPKQPALADKRDKPATDAQLEKPKEPEKPVKAETTAQAKRPE